MANYAELAMENIKRLIDIKKAGNGTFKAEYDDKLVFAEIDIIMSALGEISKFSDTVNNALSEAILKRIIANLFLERNNADILEDEEAVVIEHYVKESGVRLYFTIGKITKKEWGQGYIYSLRDSEAYSIQ